MVFGSTSASRPRASRRPSRWSAARRSASCPASVLRTRPGPRSLSSARWPFASSSPDCTIRVPTDLHPNAGGRLGHTRKQRAAHCGGRRIAALHLSVHGLVRGSQRLGDLRCHGRRSRPDRADRDRHWRDARHREHREPACGTGRDSHDVGRDRVLNGGNVRARGRGEEVRHLPRADRDDRDHRGRHAARARRRRADDAARPRSRLRRHRRRHRRRTPPSRARHRPSWTPRASASAR